MAVLHWDLPGHVLIEWSNGPFRGPSGALESLLRSFRRGTQRAVQHGVGAPGSACQQSWGCSRYFASDVCHLYIVIYVMALAFSDHVTLIVQKDSLPTLYMSGNYKGMMNSICLPGIDFCFRFLVLRVLGCYYIYVNQLFKSFWWWKTFLLLYFRFCLISMVWSLVFWKIFRISFRVASLFVYLPLSLAFLFFWLLTLTL